MRCSAEVLAASSNRPPLCQKTQAGSETAILKHPIPQYGFFHIHSPKFLPLRRLPTGKNAFQGPDLPRRSACSARPHDLTRWGVGPRTRQPRVYLETDGSLNLRNESGIPVRPTSGFTGFFVDLLAHPGIPRLASTAVANLVAADPDGSGLWFLICVSISAAMIT